MIQLTRDEVMTPEVVDATLKTIQFNDLPIDIRKKMASYSQELRRKHPKMTPKRMQTLVSRKFNIILV